MADSIREALTKAVAEAETSAEPIVPTGTTETPVIETGAVEPNVETKALAAESDAKTQEGKPSGEPSPAAATPSQGANPSLASTQQAPGAATSTTDTAPASWNAEEKKHWATLPKEAQAAVIRRETEMRRAMNSAQEATKFKKGFDTAIHKFEPLLKERGVSDIMGQVVAPLMTIRAGLEIGSPQQKAMLVGSIVRDFGIDISMLDQYLTHLANTGGLGKPGAPPPPPAPAFNPQASPELAPLFAIAERLKQAEDERATKLVDEIRSLPHYEELREKVADVLDAARERGQKITVLEAYDRAAAFYGFEPRVKPAMSVSDAAATLARSRRAASSVSGAPITSPSKKPTGLREQIEAAWQTSASS